MSNTGAISPAEVLFYQNSSLLDTVFVNKSKKKPVWITVTSGSQTTLYSVSPSGELTSAAMIEWDSKGNGSKKSEVTVKFGEETFSGHKFGQPSGGFYGPSRSVVIICADWTIYELTILTVHAILRLMT
jgi:hypothetical protein